MKIGIQNSEEALRFNVWLTEPKPLVNTVILDQAASRRGYLVLTKLMFAPT